MDNCIFCKIINGDIPSTKIYEDDNVVAFLDISQVTKGHTLLVPKYHVSNVYDLSEEQISTINRHIPRLARTIKETFGAKGINILNNNGEEAGQTVFHYHVHIIPRYGNEHEGFKLMMANNMDKYSKEDLEKIADIIKSKL